MKKTAEKLIKYYDLKAGSKFLMLDVAGYLLYELMLIEPGLKIYGTDISAYAIKNSKKEVRNYLAKHDI